MTGTEITLLIFLVTTTMISINQSSEIHDLNKRLNYFIGEHKKCKENTQQKQK